MKINLSQISFVLLIFTIVFILSSCRKDDSNPTQLPIGIYDGEWIGTTKQNEPLSFNVVNNAITSVTVSYQVKDSNYNQKTKFYKELIPPVGIVNDSIKLYVDVYRSVIYIEFFTILGKFGSENSSSGELFAYTFEYDYSGGKSHWVSINWSASKQ